MSEFDDVVEKKAQANVDWHVRDGRVKPNQVSESLKLARIIFSIEERVKEKRSFTMQPSPQQPFNGCNAVCEIPGRNGAIEGPNDFCKVINDRSGILYFCTAPNGPRLTDGSPPLCFNYHQSHWNKNGIKKVTDGSLRI